MKSPFLLLISFLVFTCFEANALRRHPTYLGLEFTNGIFNSNIDLPGLLRNEIAYAEGGVGYKLGAGIHYVTPFRMSIRTGLQFSSLPFSARFRESRNAEDYVDEDGRLSYLGMYLRIGAEFRYVYLGAGLDGSFGRIYKTDRLTYDDNVLVGSENGVRNSVVSDRFNNQLHMIGEVHVKIPIGDRFIIRPTFFAGVGMNSIYPTEPVSVLSSTPWLTISYRTPQIIDLQYYGIIGGGIGFEWRFFPKTDPAQAMPAAN